MRRSAGRRLWAEKRSLIGRNKREHLIGQISMWTHYFSPIKWSRLFRPIRELLARGKTSLFTSVLHKATLVSAGATQRLLSLLLQWSEMGILGPIMMRILLLSHWVLHRRQVFAHVWNQDTRLTYFWSVKEWELFRLIYDNFKIYRTFRWICLIFSSLWTQNQNNSQLWLS